MALNGKYLKMEAMIRSFKRISDARWKTIRRCYLNLLKSTFLFNRRPIFGDQKTPRLNTSGIVLHVQSYGPPCLSASAHMIELETHQRLKKRTLAIRLMTNN
jgi:hypothetical protein